MTISTNDIIEKFGTLDDLDSSAAAVADDAFSVSGDLASWTNDDDAPSAAVVGLFTFGTAPDSGSVINLYARPINIADTTKDSPTPDADFEHVFIGAFPLNNVTSEQVIPIEVRLPNAKAAQEYEFYIENKGGQTLSSGWSLQITPKTLGPHA